MSFLPEKIVRTNNGGTSIISEIYYLDSWVNLNLIGFFILLFFLVLLAPAIAALLLLFYCIDINSDETIGLNIFGILISAYLIFDIHKNWFMKCLMSIIYDDKDMHQVVYFNGAMLLANLVGLIFREAIFDLAGRNKYLSFLYMVVISIFCYLISQFIFSNNIIKIF